MDKSIRINQHCVVGLPRCDFAFSSTRSCFIAYGFRESPLEMGLLRQLLEKRGIQAVEAGGVLAPGQNVFCAKICSKIITAQFCAVLLNNDDRNGVEIPNANVNMEYGLMLGFNKYVIPFQREDQKLPFNVAGIDTVKYATSEFERRASEALDHAIAATTQESPSSPLAPDQVIETFALLHKKLFTHVDSPGEQALFRLGTPLGFNLLNDFAGLRFVYLGKFMALRPEATVWRIRMLEEILTERRKSLSVREAAGIVDLKEVSRLEQIVDQIRIWAIVTSEHDKAAVERAFGDVPLSRTLEVHTIGAIERELSEFNYAAG